MTKSEMCLERTIADYVSRGIEFQYLMLISQYYKVDYKWLVDFTLDNYNYQRRLGLDKVGAKIMVLSNSVDYCCKEYSK